MIARFLAIGLLLLSTAKTGAQQFGAFPPATQWKQINSDTARVIFTEPVNSEAQRISAIIHQMARQNANPLGGAVRKINLLLHPRTTQANGYVGLAPFRSEFYLIPASNLFAFGATPWIEELAVHEYRHVQQYSNFNKGLSKVASAVFGQQGQALLNAMAIPDWFFEGDAVHSETALTTQGRGRAPYFFNGFRALWNEGKDYSWMKLRNGSFKDFVPNHYNLGYLLTNYGYLHFGSDFWGRVTDDASRYRHLFYPFQHAIKKEAGQSFSAFRKAALAYYHPEKKAEPPVRQRDKTVTDYLFPQQIGADSLLYLKTAYHQLPAFYLKDHTGEHRLKQRNISSEDWFAYRHGTLAYTAYATHPRWGLINYSNVYLLDIRTGKEKKITSGQRYFTPDISADGSRLVVVSFTNSLTSALCLLNRSGALLKTIHPPATGDLFVHPRFASAQSIVVALRHKNATMSLVRLSWTDDESSIQYQTLLGPTAATLGYLFVQESQMVFVSAASGNDEVYSMDLSAAVPEKTLRRLTNTATGNYFPSVYRNTLTLSNFTTRGFQVVQQSLSFADPDTSIQALFRQRILPYAVATDAATPNILLTAENRTKPVDSYRKSTGLFQFHSRQLTYDDPELTVSIISDNMLNTFSNDVFYRYNQNELSHAVGFTSSYGGFFPVLTAGLTYTANRHLKTTTNTFTLNQKEARIGYSIPLNFTEGKSYKYLNFGSSAVFNQTVPTGKSRQLLNGRTVWYLSHTVNWSQQLPRAVQQFFPRFGYAVGLAHRHLLSQRGFQFLGGTRLYLPAVKNHSLVLAANLQETDTSNIVFGNRFANSRGYNDYLFSRMWSLSGNYHLPLFYPDWGFADLLYFLRVRSNFFYDFTRVYSKDKRLHQPQRSVGAEIYFDTKWWNMLPVSFGLRLSHLLDDDFSGLRPKGTNVLEFILPVDLIPR